MFRGNLVYNFYICRFCEFVYNDPDYIDCGQCGKSMCVLLFQAKNKEGAIKIKRDRYGK